VDDGMAQSLFLYSATKEGDYVKVVCNASDPNQRLDVRQSHRHRHREAWTTIASGMRIGLVV
jgi:hypothetical protein